MTIQHYLAMVGHASAAQRCHAAGALAHIYLETGRAFEDRCAAEAALTLLLDDPSPKVRLALAEAFSTSAHAPVHIVASLSRDQIEIATYMLARSTVLTDIDLIDCVAAGCGETQKVVAGRARVSFAVSAALIEIAEPIAIQALLANSRAQIADISFRRLIERFGHMPDVRSLLADDDRLPADCRHALAIKVAEALCRMDIVMALMGERRAKRITSEACVKASISLVAATPPVQYPALIEHLQLRGDLTTAFVIRIVASGKIDFFGAVLVSLSGQNLSRVRNLLIDGRDAALAALFNAAGLPDSTHQPLRIALHAWRDVANGKLAIGPQEVTRRMMEHLVPENHGLSTDLAAANDDMQSLLRKIYLEAIRENARDHALAMAAA
ncbi:DUF2336 domain-containing protein [Phyllobacterium myrsinacearum]|uniref:Uncharacterized protein (DUF2336 family) n=1 Tax=Phyllobacterium myrsinacearum TaxID=28101 RepID=A0A839EN58_9HYPH|nr:DUF2336 domain-containing protein [Phyllobacterium myrsinacearum]MBA8880282.1 uncharacterized protein (DUF2336 family) [Phyllobacterium myrsinacearum]